MIFSPQALYCSMDPRLAWHHQSFSISLLLWKGMKNLFKRALRAHTQIKSRAYLRVVISTKPTFWWSRASLPFEFFHVLSCTHVHCTCKFAWFVSLIWSVLDKSSSCYRLTEHEPTITATHIDTLLPHPFCIHLNGDNALHWPAHPELWSQLYHCQKNKVFLLSWANHSVLWKWC